MLALGRTYNVGGDDLSSRSVDWVSGGDARLNSNSMSVSVMVVVTPKVVVVVTPEMVVMRKCLYVSSSPPHVWCHHPPSPMHVVWMTTPPSPPLPPRTTYGADAGRRLSIEQKY